MMLGLGYQELLLLVIIAGMLLFVYPAILYAFSFVCLKVLKSPRYVLLVLWVLTTALILRNTDGASGPIDLAVTILTVIAAVMGVVLLAAAFAWLWVMGWFLERIGITRLGAAWRDMSATHLRALRLRAIETG